MYRLLSVDSLVVPTVVFLNELGYSGIQLQAVACRVQVDMVAFQGTEEPFDLISASSKVLIQCLQVY